ncbi:MAG: AI-2E family transporter [Bifidobacteriaceae bacterium]|jgi:predicted PurR-regulated permease PerM|nr:AI-2E family transporter [Bifidobacteriaceae bacterium]
MARRFDQERRLVQTWRVQNTSPQLDGVPRWLQVGAGNAWRMLVLLAAVYIAGRGVMEVELVAVALFVSFVITSVLRPLVNLLDRIRWMPRPLATGMGFIVAVGVIGGIGTFVGVSVANQIPRLTDELINGIDAINEMLSRLPAPFDDLDLGSLGETVSNWIRENSSTLVGEVITRFGVVAEVLTALILALFCSVFFINSGTSIWQWLLSQFRSETAAKLDAAGLAAWTTFSGYTRGIVIVGVTNGLFAGLALAFMGIPLATPIGVLVSMGTFIPYVGSAIAMTVAIVVALAAKGPWWALAVVALVVLIGQIEGHLLQPLIMSKQVRLHPVAVAVAVVAGALTAGVVGAIVAVPAVAVCWAVFSRLRAISAELTGELEEPPKAAGKASS